MTWSYLTSIGQRLAASDRDPLRLACARQRSLHVERRHLAGRRDVGHRHPGFPHGQQLRTDGVEIGRSAGRLFSHALTFAGDCFQDGPSLPFQLGEVLVDAAQLRAQGGQRRARRHAGDVTR
jgi:hypothetical protein